MIRLVVERVFSAVPVFIIVSLVTFFMLRVIPGDPAAVMAGPNSTPDIVAQIRQDMGLDMPILRQLGNWYLDLARGDFGRSLQLGESVSGAIASRLPVTIALSLYALVITIVLGLAAGIFAALRQNSWVDQLAMVLSIVGISVPNFYLGLLMIILFSVKLGWLPSGGYIPFTADPLGWLRTSTMPALATALMMVGLLARTTRSSMLEVLRQDYIRTATAKGLAPHTVVLKHALTNAMGPIITVIGVIISLMISGSVVIEAMFSIPGVGQVLTNAVLNRDYPLVQGGLLIVTALMIAINVGIDILCAALDPRSRGNGH